ncbi:hypothetical protein, partial [Streptococcus pseudopneumoniae]|uniref:hypothetical protein n=1 Tax=Streptococcus pseudopneumoniae TaxID=257758 RepID=UPI001BB16B2C
NKSRRRIIRMIKATIKKNQQIAVMAFKQYDIATDRSSIGGENQQSIAKKVWESTLREVR